MRLSVCFSILFVLSGCANDCTNHPNPDAKIPICNQAKSLSEGTSCVVQVAANKRETVVGLTVNQGEEYRVIATPNQTWCDSSRTNIPLCGEEGSNLMNIFSPLKRVENSLWFSIIAEVIDDKRQRRSQFDLCNTPKFEISTPGKLILYPNDAESFYGNNSGEIWLEIWRLKAQ